MFRNQGFIFLMTLVLMSMTSLFVLTLMHTVLLFYQSSNQLRRVHQDFYQLEKTALSILSSQECMVPDKNPNEILGQLIRKEVGCTLAQDLVSYRYILEDLGEFPCLVAYNQGKKHATHHYRLSLLSLDKNSESALLQMRFIRNSLLRTPCDQKESIVHRGVSSWRYFSDSSDFF